MKNGKSTTLWITISIIILNPLSWIIQFLFNRLNMTYLVENGVKVEELSQYVSLLSFNLPLSTLATAAVTAVGLYIGGQKGKAISYNAGQPANQGLNEKQGDDH